jgi:hypothetical protein
MARKKLYAAQINEILKRYRAGETQNSLAVAFDVSLSLITATIRRNKAERKLSDPARNVKATLVPVVSQEILNLRKIADDPRYGADVRLLAAEKLQTLEKPVAQADEEEFDYFAFTPDEQAEIDARRAQAERGRPQREAEARARHAREQAERDEKNRQEYAAKLDRERLEAARTPKPGITVDFAGQPGGFQPAPSDPSLQRERDIWSQERSNSAQTFRERDPWEL